MDHQTFDRLTRSFSASKSRRDAVRIVLATLLGGAGLGERADALARAGKRKRKARHENTRSSRRRDDDNNDKRDDRQRGGKDHKDRLASAGKGGKRRKGKGKGKAKNKGRDKRACARAGQAPKRGSPCCNGLIRDGAGRCAEPPSPPPPPTDPCVGDSCTDPPPTCADTCAGCCQNETCRMDTGEVVCGEGGAPCEPCPCTPDCENKICGPDGCDGECGEGCPPHATCTGNGDACTCDIESCASACCAEGQRCCANQCVTGVCCGADDCPTFTCEITDCANNQCQNTPITGQTDANCTTVCCDGACCPDGESECTPDGDCVQCQSPSNCPRPPDCKQATCVAGVCGIADAPNGTSCPAPTGGAASCFQGICNKLCSNNLHRICGPNPGVCQECCNDDRQCSSIDEASTCVSGTCRCPGSLTRCGMECIDTSREPNHCGSCTTVCNSGTCNNGLCAPPESCGGFCDPNHNPNCDGPEFCSGDRVCLPAVNGTCRCPSGWVDCDGNGFCEACGRCGVTCPDDPDTGDPGFCCPGGFCSCGGECGDGCEECWLTPTGQDQEGDPTGFREQCDTTGGCVDCWGECCTACINGNCASSGPIGGGSIRRR